MPHPIHPPSPQRGPLRTRGRGSDSALAWLIGAIALGVLLAAHARALDEGPVWDTAMAMFPAAIALEEANFDGAVVASQPSFHEGGPNWHLSSLVTWGTAGVIRLTSGGAALFPLLHLLHLVLAALAVRATFLLAAPLTGRPLAIGAAALLLVDPLFWGQAGRLYMEIPLVLCSVEAIRAHAGDRPRAAVVWALLACLVKESGIVVAGVLALFVLARRAPLSARLPRAALFLLGPLAMGSLALWLRSNPGDPRPLIPWVYFVWARLGPYLLAVPDLIVLLFAFAVLGVLHRRRLRAHPSALLLWAFPLALGAFHLAAPLVIPHHFVLPRYYVQALPFLFVALALGLRWSGGGRVARAAIAALLVFHSVNQGGALYPAPGESNEFSVAERSGESRELAGVQRLAMRRLEELSAHTPVRYGLYEHFLGRYPLMGWVERPLSGGCLYPPGAAADVPLDAQPDAFSVLLNFEFLGGARARALVRAADADPNWEVRREPLGDGRYTMTLAHLRRIR